MKKIFIATSSFGTVDRKPIKFLESHSYKVILNNKGRRLSSLEIIEDLVDCVGVIAGTEKYDLNVLYKLNKLKVISRLGVGIDNIDLKIAKERGINVLRTNTTPAISVSELSLGLMLNIVRKISEKHEKLKNGIWQKDMGNLLSGKTLGIIGLGVIGKTMVQLVKGFNFNILAFDMIRDNKFAKENKVKYCNIDKLLSNSDIISIHLNLSVKTNNFMNEERLNKMKHKSIIINTSRGEIVDEGVLYKLLKEQKILGAGLDVFNNEPYSGPLTELDNVILTPHIGSYTKEVRTKMEIEASENLIKGLNEA